MGKNKTTIVFSGGCFSGKTTSIDSIYANYDGKCTILSEFIRDENYVSIDNIRANPHEYLQLQKKVIKKKIDQELSIANILDDTVVLIDRSIADSIFYLTFYVDKHALSSDDLNDLYDLYKYASAHAQFMYKRVYSYVLLFKPLVLLCNDAKFRPESINSVSKYLEYDLIKASNLTYTHELIDVDLNKTPTLFSDKQSCNNFINSLKYGRF